MSGQDGDKGLVGKTITFQPKVALVKPNSNNEGPKGNLSQVQSQQTQHQQATATPYRPPMRIVVPAGAVQTPSAQIIQTHLLQPAMLKQVDPSGRTQITAMPARSLTQTSITVTRSPTPTSFVPRATTVTGARTTVVGNPRTPTPPTANITTNFVRSTGSNSSRTPSPAATVISPGTTWMSTVSGGVQVGVHGTQLIRASLNQTGRPQGRVLTQTSAGGTVVTTTSANSSGLAPHVSNQVVTVTQQQQPPQQQKTMVGAAGPQQLQQTTTGGQILATLATVQCPPRQQTATLVYSNVSAAANAAGQRVTLGHQRPVRPIQLTATNSRLSSAGIRAANISIRPPPVLTASANVLATALPGAQGAGVVHQQSQQQQQPGGGPGRGNTTTSNLTATNLATRIIQVQQPPGGGATQVINAGRLQTANLMTLTPVVMSATPAAGARNAATSLTGKVQPSLTITHMGKLTPQQQQQQQQQVSLAAAQQHHNVTVVSQHQSQSGQVGTTTMQPSIAQIVSVGQQQQQTQSQGPMATNQGHQIMAVSSSQHQLISGGNSVATTVLPLSAITTRPMATIASAGGHATAGLVRTITTAPTAPHSVTTTVASGTTLLPLAKPMTQQQQIAMQHQLIEGQPGIFIHSRSPNPGQATAAGGPAGILTLAAATSSASINNIISAVSYSSAAPNNSANLCATGNNSGSFAVVTNRATGAAIGIQGVLPVVSSTVVPATVVSSTSSGGAGGGIQSQPHQIITMTTNQTAAQHHHAQQQQQLPQHIMIPVPTKGNTMAASAVTSARSSILRKRDSDGVITGTVAQATSAGSPVVKGVKNLVPILHAMGSSNSANAAAVNVPPSAKVELITKDRTMTVSPPAGSPSDGSTTVSATSSPGVDKQQVEEELNALSRKLQSELYKTSKEKEVTGKDVPLTATAVGRQSSSREASPRKKSRKQANHDSTTANMTANLSDLNSGSGVGGKNQQTGNKDNSHPVSSSASSEVTAGSLKKARLCSLLEAYKHNWKAAHNHFQRYSDVKPREERRPTVIDLANQAHVTQKVNGWKVYHLSAQMEDLCEMESQVYDKLSEMLQCMEAHEQNADVDRVNDLLKGNLQRSKIINDGVREARHQIMKVFDHKTHVSDIIHRCASKRNFKKREKY